MTFEELKALATVPVGDFTTWPAPYGQMSVTLEDAGFLYALVRVTKPSRVLELGGGLGISARFIAEALAENGGGTLTVVEPDKQYWEALQEMLIHLPTALSTSSNGIGFPDLVFIDSGWDRREQDITDWLSGDYTGLVCVHDAGRAYPGLALGVGVYLPGSDGLWLGRGA